MKLETSAPWLIAIVASTFSLPAYAEQPIFSRVSLLVPSCEMDGVGDADLREAAALELQAQSVSLAPLGELSSSDALVRFESSCVPGSEVVVRAAWAGQERVRTLNIGELPARTRARALALSLAELLGSFRKGVEPEPIVLSESEPAPRAPEEPAASEPAPPQPSAPPAAAKPPNVLPKQAPIQWLSDPRTVDRAANPRPSASRGTELGVAGEARLFGAGDVVSGLRPHLDAGIVSIGLSVTGGSAAADYGSVEALLLHAVCVLRLLETSPDEPITFSAGPRFGLGMVRVLGMPYSDGVGLEAIDLYADAGASGMLELRPASWIRFGLGVEAGYARGMVALADTDPVAEFGGVFIAGLADLSFSL